MSSYSVFAEYYDALTDNVEYSKRADYLLVLLEKLGHTPGLTLDLACGTGSLTLELYRRGIDVYGVDASAEMLTMAREKCLEQDADILFLCQKAQALDLYGTVDTTVCMLDSLNHLRGEDELKKAFSRVSLFTNPGGWFIFDMNTPYKHEQVLGNNTFVYDTEKVYCVWQNHFFKKDCRVQVDLDFFEEEDGVYYRSGESFSERAYPREKIVELLESAGFGDLHIYDELTFDPPREDSQRLFYAARKLG